MKFTPKHYASALFSALNETEAKFHDKVLDNFVEILRASGDLSKFPEIEAELNLLTLKQKGILPVNVTTARSIDNPGVLKDLNNIVAGKTEVKNQVDNSILGGVVIRSEDILFDSSIKTQLNNLNQSLKS